MIGQIQLIMDTSDHSINSSIGIKLLLKMDVYLEANLIVKSSLSPPLLEIMYSKKSVNEFKNSDLHELFCFQPSIIFICVNS